MIDIDNWMRELEEEEDIEIKNNEEYQTKLFEEYVLRGSDHQEERRKLNERYLSGEELMGEHGLRKELAAFDMSYFGRAYLPHYFIRKSPHFHEELDEIWSRGVMKGRNPLKEAKVISRLKGSRQVVAAPRGHAKSTNFTFKDSLHAILYAYKHYILILSDSSEQAEGFLDDIKTELEDNANIIMDFGSLKGDKAWRTGVILTKTDIKAEAIGSGKKVRGRRHRNWRPDLIVLDDIENDENVNTPEQRRKLKNWFDKAVSKAGDTYTDIMYIGTILHYDSLLNNELLDGVNIKTSLPSPECFVKIFEEAKNKKEEVVCILISSGFSGTYQGAMLAKSMVDYEGIYIIDSKCAAAAEKQIAFYACELREKGMSGKEIAEELEKFRSRVRLIACLDTLEYLARGGRLPKTVAAIGNKLQFKPIITFTKEGEIEVVKKTRGAKKAMRDMAVLAEDRKSVV